MSKWESHLEASWRKEKDRAEKAESRATAAESRLLLLERVVEEARGFCRKKRLTYGLHFEQGTRANLIAEAISAETKLFEAISSLHSPEKEAGK